MTFEEITNKENFEFSNDLELELFTIHVYIESTQELGVETWQALREYGLIDSGIRRFLFIFHKPAYKFSISKQFLMRDYYNENLDFFTGKVIAVVNDSPNLSAAISITQTTVNYMKLKIFSTEVAARDWVLKTLAV
ncbi:MAG: hypothetical protein ACK5IJ_04550 [Mangrovibacterium sp.]